MTNDQNLPMFAKENSQVTDALTLWSDEIAPAHPIAPPLVRLDTNECLVIFFSTSMLRVKVHFLDFAAVRGYVHCRGSHCLMCRLGRQVETRDLLPVYDAVNKMVAVLPISANLRPHALRPQLVPILHHLKENPRLVIGISKLDNVRFAVSTYPLTDGADDGADVILPFLEKFEKGHIDLGDVYVRMTNEELAAVPELSTTMALKGIKLA